MAIEKISSSSGTERKDESARRFSVLGEDGEGRQDRHQIVFGDGVEEARSGDEALQSGAGGGQEGADQDGPLVGPGDVRHHQTAADARSEPGVNENREQYDYLQSSVLGWMAAG